MSLADDLKAIVTGGVNTSPEVLEKASRDASLFRVIPQAVVAVKDAADVSALVKYVTKEKKSGVSLSVTARAAGTDMSGGPLNSGIIADMTGLNRVIEVGESSAVVEPGTYFRDFDKKTKEKNLELPSYTASREWCTVGGMVANDSGGEKNLKYGKTSRYVEELDVVLADGEVHTLKNLSGEVLSQKLAEKSYEGDIYRAVAKLLKENTALIQSARPTVAKNSAGYALWDIGDGEKTLNLARLMSGSQGTLGIITKIKFSLVRPKPYSAMVVMFLTDLKELSTIVPDVLLDKPDSFESYDDNTFKLAVKYFPEFALQMKGNLFTLGWSFLPEVLMAATGGVPKLILLAEFRGETQEEALQKAEALYGRLKKDNPQINARIAQNEQESRKYWVVRRESFNLLRKKVRGMRTAPFIDDFVVPPMSLPEFFPKLTEILSHYDLMYTVTGHVGDGNFHIIPLIDPKRRDMAQVIDELSHKVYDLVLSYKGSISGEHNDGLVRTPYVEKMFGVEMYKLFGEVKHLFDPLDIFNPGKKVGTTFSQSMGHLDFPR
ncbi:FAD-binding oxidoreductase [Patescibacteria group bacterium]|nr:FAD-binding oxidoreductase [Patescibacteria group bacterium]